ncbi:MAG: hypothetical protein ACREBE_17905 [bacterium]
MTQRADAADFDDVAAGGLGGDATAIVGAAATLGAGVGVIASPDATLTTLGGAWLGAGTTCICIFGAAVSRAGCDVCCAVDRVVLARLGSESRSSHATPTIATSAAAPTPFQMRGAFGGGSGFVPHHRHDPIVSG